MISIIDALTLASTRTPLGQAPDINIPWLRIALVLLFSLALALAAIFAIRRRQGGSNDIGSMLRGLIQLPGESASQLTVEERLRVSASNQLLVLRWGGVRYLVHVAPSGAQLLDQHAVASEEAA